MSDEQNSQQQETRPRYRAGQVIAYRVTDTISGDEVSGHGLVLKVSGDVVDVAVLGTGHLQVHVDTITPATAGDVPNPLPAPEPGEGTGS